jgi:hypothetical protein
MEGAFEEARAEQVMGDHIYGHENINEVVWSGLSAHSTGFHMERRARASSPTRFLA